MKIKYLSVCEDNQDLCKYVETGDILISNERLYTSKVGTCSILMFKLLDLNVMAHIDAGETKKEYLIEKIKNTFSDFELKNIKKIYLIIGPWCDKYCYENNNTKCECHSIQIAKNTLVELDLIDKLYILEEDEANMTWETDIWFDGKIIIK
jgi:hypothetical protein